MKTLLAVAFLLLGIASAHAECVAPPTQRSPDGINFILGIDPSDGILDVWCRIQQLQGEYEIVVNFLDVGAKRSFTVQFDGTPSRDRIEFATFIQSLLPTEDGPALDDKGMNFGKVLEQSVQVRAPRSLSSGLLPVPEEMGVPPVYQFANDLIMWTPVSIDVKPVRIAGADFTLRVSFRPSFGRYLMGKNSMVEELILRGFHKNVLRDAGPSRDVCPQHIPECKEFGDVIDLHTAWTFNSITLHAAGNGLSAAAQQLLTQIAMENEELLGLSAMKGFSPTVGEASFTATGKARVIDAEAVGDEQRIAGTQVIQVRWTERMDTKNNYQWVLKDYARRSREAMVLANPTQN